MRAIMRYSIGISPYHKDLHYGDTAYFSLGALDTLPARNIQTKILSAKLTINSIKTYSETHLVFDDYGWTDSFSAPSKSGIIVNVAFINNILERPEGTPISVTVNGNANFREAGATLVIEYEYDENSSGSPSSATYPMRCWDGYTWRSAECKTYFKGNWYNCIVRCYMGNQWQVCLKPPDK